MQGRRLQQTNMTQHNVRHDDPGGRTAGPGRGWPERRRLCVRLGLLFCLVLLTLLPVVPPGPAPVSASPWRSQGQDHLPLLRPQQPMVGCSWSGDGNPFQLCPGPFPRGGNCVWWAWEQWHWLGYDLPRDWGNAADWISDAWRTGLAVGRVPQIGAIAVFPRADGVWAFGPEGHVAFVTAVSPDGQTFNVTYQNYGDPQPVYVGTGYQVSVINQPRFQNGQLRFLYFPRLIDPTRFARLPGVGMLGKEELAAITRLNALRLASGSPGEPGLLLGQPQRTGGQAYQTDLTGSGHSDLLLYNRQRGQLSVLKLDGTLPPHAMGHWRAAFEDEETAPPLSPSLVSLGDSITPAGHWGSSLEIHVGQFAGTSASDLLLYDRQSGTLQLLSFNTDFSIKEHVVLPSIGTGWQIVTGRFDGERTDVLLFRPLLSPVPASAIKPEAVPPTATSTATGTTGTPTRSQPTATATATGTSCPPATPATATTSSSTSSTASPAASSPTSSACSPASATPTATVTAQPTPTSTATAASTPTATATSAATSTPTTSQTITPTPAQTPASPTPEATAAATRSVSPVLTPTSTPAATSTISAKSSTVQRTARKQAWGLATPLAPAPEAAAQVVLLAFDQHFQVLHRQEYRSQSAGWELYPGAFVSAKQDGLVLYDRINGVGQLVAFDEALHLTIAQPVDTPAGNWLITSGDFAGSGRAQVLLYDPSTGNARLLAFDTRLRQSQQQIYTDWGTHLVPYVGHFGASTASVMLADQEAGQSIFLTFDRNLSLARRVTASSWDRHWQILVGAFPLQNAKRCGGQTSCSPANKTTETILVLNRQDGRIEQYRVAFAARRPVFDNRVQAFMRLGAATDATIMPVEALTLNLASILHTGIHEEELY